ncbi:MAG: BatA domain-containing protein, partial [Phycisphaeraceae bacterium]|nr:BatA domain-containing protein [Phycisphaeraceae bacterium]
MTILAQAGISLLHPGLAAAGAAAVSIPIIIHLLSRYRRRRQPWAAMRFLREAFEQQRRRMRLEQWLLLAARCLVVSLLGLALAGPLLSGCASTGGLASTQRQLWLVVDDSLSSRASAGDQARRIDRLRETGSALMDGLGPGDEIAIVRAGTPGPELLLPPTNNHEEVREAWAEITGRYGQAALADATALVDSYLTEHPPEASQVVLAVLSDFTRQAVEDDPLVPDPDGALAGLGDRLLVVTPDPMTGRGNSQVESFTPRHHLVIAREGSDVRMPVTVSLQRLNGDLPERATGVTVRALAADGEENQTLAEVQLEHRWRAGQAQAQLQTELLLERASVDQRLAGRNRIPLV